MTLATGPVTLRQSVILVTGPVTLTLDPSFGLSSNSAQLTES